MSNILPDRFQLDPVFLRPPKLRNGTFRPISSFDNLLNHELLLVLNGKPLGFTLDFSLEQNLGITGYEFDNTFTPYNAQNRQDMNDIFQLAEINDMNFIKASRNPGWAVYFQDENANQALIFDYFIRNYNPKSLVSSYIVSSLQGYTIPDIEANLFCYRNGQNIVELRAQNANNLTYIVNRGNQIINQLQESSGFIKYLKKIKIRKVSDFIIPEPN